MEERKITQSYSAWNSILKPFGKEVEIGISQSPSAAPNQPGSIFLHEIDPSWARSIIVIPNCQNADIANDPEYVTLDKGQLLQTLRAVAEKTPKGNVTAGAEASLIIKVDDGRARLFAEGDGIRIEMTKGQLRTSPMGLTARMHAKFRKANGIEVHRDALKVFKLRSWKDCIDHTCILTQTHSTISQPDNIHEIEFKGTMAPRKYPSGSSRGDFASGVDETITARYQGYPRQSVPGVTTTRVNPNYLATIAKCRTTMASKGHPVAFHFDDEGPLLVRWSDRHGSAFEVLIAPKNNRDLDIRAEELTDHEYTRRNYPLERTPEEVQIRGRSNGVRLIMTNVTVTKEIEISNYDIWSALVGAFEGGSNYWYYADWTLPEGMTHTGDKPGWKEIVKAENDQRLAESNYSSGGDYLPWGMRCEEDLEFLKQHNVYQYFHQLPFLGGSLIITEDSADGEELGILDYAAIERGMQQFAEEGHRHWDNFYEERGDSITSDVMLQLMVMGKVVYG